MAGLDRTGGAMTRFGAVALLALGTPLISGCIAAVVPLAAGAALVRQQASQESPAAPPAAVASDRGDFKVVNTGLTVLPAPLAPTPPVNPAVAAFLGYGLSQARVDSGANRRISAILPAASELRAVRAPCAALPPAVFIDLDPGRGTFDPLAPGEPDAALGDALAALRKHGIKVVWFSRLGANFAVGARTALVEGGLDPDRADEIMLMRDLGERKQSLRDAVAQRACPIAMLGDERADFDELYLYLRDPARAAELDAMIGKGWFLASPFLPRAGQPGQE